MAIINCPECNGKISDTVKQCVHCGAPITVCPECGTVFAKRIDTCPECGYIINKNKNTNNIKNKSTNANTDQKPKNKVMNADHAFHEWSKKNNMNATDIISILCFVVGIALAVIAYFKLKNWTESYMEMVTTYKDTISSITTLTVIACILFFVGTIFDVFDQKSELEGLSLWAKGRNSSLKEIIIHTLSMDLSKKKPERLDDISRAMVYALNSELYDTSVSSKRRFSGWIAMRLICSLAFSVGALFFILHNLEIYMTAELFKSDRFDIPGFSFSMIENWWLLGIAVGSSVIKGFYNFYIKKISKKDRRDWVKQNHPEGLEAYDKYMDGFNVARQVGDDISKNGTRGGI